MEVRTTTLSIAGMSCGSCVRHVTRALDRVKGVIHAQVDLAKNQATVEHLAAFTPESALVAAIREARYVARVIDTTDDSGFIGEALSSYGSCGCGCCGGSHRTDESR